MILLIHLLLGALIGQKISNPLLAILLAYFSHYFLDLFPHIEYPIENIKNKNWKKSLPDFFRVFIDFVLGVVLIFLFSKNYLMIYVCAFFTILPDGFSLLSSIFSRKILFMHDYFHEKIHFLKHKKISIFWRISTQIFAIIISIYLLKI
jgi:hypothetical protein